MQARTTRCSRRAFMASALGIAALRVRPAAAVPAPSLAADVSMLLMVGFAGPTPHSPTASRLIEHVRQGRVASVFLVRNNVGTRSELQALTARFRSARADLRLGIDHEGGAVQRLRPIHGCRLVPKAIDIPRQMAPDEARQFYREIGLEVAAAGFDINFAPVVDLYSPDNPAVGKFGRAFSADPQVVTRYARAFIEGFRASGIACAVKHFPGYGRATEDSHDRVPDITHTWTRYELEPFSRLIASHDAQLIMGTHLRLATLDPVLPTTLSPRITTGLLRKQMHFAGVIMTDDIDMAAIARKMDRRTALIDALAAGNDLVMVANVARHDPDFPVNAVQWVQEAIARGTLSRAQIAASAQRVRSLFDGSRQAGGPA